MASPVSVSDSTSVGNVKGVATILIVVVALVLVVVFFNKIMQAANSFLEGIGLKDDPNEAADKT